MKVVKLLYQNSAPYIHTLSKHQCDNAVARVTIFMHVPLSPGRQPGASGLNINVTFRRRWICSSVCFGKTVDGSCECDCSPSGRRCLDETWAPYSGYQATWLVNSRHTSCYFSTLYLILVIFATESCEYAPTGFHLSVWQHVTTRERLNGFVWNFVKEFFFY
jgi:hypothetical protein